MARIYKREGRNGPVWYLDYKAEGRRIRKRLGKSRKLAESALARIRTQLERKEVAKTVSGAAQAATILDRPVVILPLEEYRSLLVEAGRKPGPRLLKVAAKRTK